MQLVTLKKCRRWRLLPLHLFIWWITIVFFKHYCSNNNELEGVH